MVIEEITSGLESKSQRINRPVSGKGTGSQIRVNIFGPVARQRVCRLRRRRWTGVTPYANIGGSGGAIIKPARGP